MGRTERSKQRRLLRQAELKSRRRKKRIRKEVARVSALLSPAPRGWRLEGIEAIGIVNTRGLKKLEIDG